MIVGLGNPGPRYARTRHNLGFWVVDLLAGELGVRLRQHWSNSLLGSGELNGQKVLLVQPQTFMNLSGEAVEPLVRYYRLPLEDLLVVYDDLDLPAGTLRIRPAGSAGGHKGMQSIITHLGSQAFPRVRLGIGRPPAPLTAAEYVLKPLDDQELAIFEALAREGAAAVRTWILEGTAAAMNKYNKANKAQGAMP
ncbi:MAG TPA: aminoacyl-tRNA hydrolase [Limnochordales bacterium]